MVKLEVENSWPVTETQRKHNHFIAVHHFVRMLCKLVSQQKSDSVLSPMYFARNGYRLSVLKTNAISKKFNSPQC